MESADLPSEIQEKVYKPEPDEVYDVELNKA